MNATAAALPQIRTVDRPLPAWLHASGLITPALALAGNLIGGPLAWAAFLMIWGVLPTLEYARIESRKTEPLSDGLLFDALILAQALLQLANVGSLIWLGHAGAPWWVLLGAALSTGSTSGISIVVSHELMHRGRLVWRFLSYLMLLTVCYTHYVVEHVFVHHRRVATEGDPASAKQSDGPWSFIVRCVIGQIRESWALAFDDWNKPRPKNRFHFLVPMAGWLAANVAFVAAVAIFAGPIAFALFVVQTLVAVMLLELINYIEHWGLRRKTGQRVIPEHSWETNSLITNFTLIELGMHADHHAHAKKPYAELVAMDGSPQMPYGYYGLTLLLFRYRRWREIMDPILATHLARLDEKERADSIGSATGEEYQLG